MKDIPRSTAGKLGNPYRKELAGRLHTGDTKPGWGICSDVEPVERMEKVLYAIDELTGLINATALMRPSKSILDLTPKSVKKGGRTAASAGVDAALSEGRGYAGNGPTDVIDHTIKGMQKVAEEIGLKENCKNQVLTFTIS